MAAGQKRILIVDDDSDTLLVLQDRLESFGYRVTVVSNARSAVQEVQGAGYALVMMDVRMPGMDGIEALHQIRTIRPNMPVIMITSSEGNAARVLAEGANAYLLKPIDPEKLKETVKRLAIVEDGR